MEGVFNEVKAHTKSNTVPNVWVGHKFIGGSDKLAQAANNGTLDQYD